MRKKLEMTLSELAEANAEFEDQFLHEMPYNAWRFFGLKSHVSVSNGHITLNTIGDSFTYGDPDFMECLEFWVTQFGGKITWENQ